MLSVGSCERSLPSFGNCGEGPFHKYEKRHKKTQTKCSTSCSQNTSFARGVTDLSLSGLESHVQLKECFSTKSALATSRFFENS
jgi:hypothetical protein